MALWNYKMRGWDYVYEVAFHLMALGIGFGIAASMFR